MPNPRKPPEHRVGRRRYPGEDGYAAPRETAPPVRRRRVPRCDFPSLGPGVWAWIAAHLVVPDGPHAGKPLELNSAQTRILYDWYRLDDAGMFTYRRGAWQAAQGTGKSPLLAAIALVELCGPTRFGGWDAKRNNPIATAPVAPWVQIAACSEDQAGNTYKAAHAMASDSDLNGTLLDVGLTRITRRDGPGILESVTASASTRFGQRVSLGILDETHLWNRRNGGIKLADTIRRSAAKMGGRTFEATNAFAVGEGSVAEHTHRAAQENPEILYVAVEAPHVEDLSDFPAVYAALKVAYGPAARPKGWVDLNRIAREVADPSTNPEDARRFYFNQLRSDAGPFDVAAWRELATPIRVADRERVALGFDGSISQDETALMGCTEGGHIFTIASWSRPEHAPADWRVPRGEVHAAVAVAFERYDVGLMLCDPPRWYSEIDEWEQLYGERVVALDTNQASRFAPLCDAFATAIAEGSLTHDGDPLLTEALAACARRNVRLRDDPDDGRTRFVVVKADTRKIDKAVAAVLAFGAAQAMPEKPEPARKRVPLAAFA